MIKISSVLVVDFFVLVLFLIGRSNKTSGFLQNKIHHGHMFVDVNVWKFSNKNFNRQCLNYLTRKKQKQFEWNEKLYRIGRIVLPIFNSISSSFSDNEFHRTTTYGRLSSEDGGSIVDVLIDREGAMNEFFTSREEWYPVFRSLAGSSLPAATAEFVGSPTSSTTGTATSTNTAVTVTSERSEHVFEFSSESFPWRRNVNPIPTLDSDRDVVAKFLDAMHQSLLDIPVDESFGLGVDESDENAYDDNDMQFVEEGRRMLALSRFMVLRKNTSHNDDSTDESFDKNTNDTYQENTTFENPVPNNAQSVNFNSISSSIDWYDQLFNLCWSEVLELKQTDVAHTGSLILLPDYSLADVRRFVDMNLIRPLEWLGIHKSFEVSSFQRHSPAIRLLYKLNPIPTPTDANNNNNNQ